MASSIIGQLRVILGLDTAAFEKGLDDAERQLLRAGKSYEQIGRRIEGIGKSLSIGLTLPIVSIGGASLKMAANFEAAMNRVEAATGSSGKELKALRDQARQFGADKSFTATATQTADVMEALAKNGLNTTQILGGATEAVLKLAAANAMDFAPAADLTTDIMQQFGIAASDLNGVVDKLTGGMLISKFGADDYRLAIGQVGGVAGGLGQTFEETNVALAATAAMFSSGSDAGTSYKTFLTSLTPKSKEAGEMMKKLGLDFFDAGGKMKPVADIAQMLRDKLGGLADEAKTKALVTIFGTDAMRSAVGLMNQGADGIARIRTEINKASAFDQMAARMKGAGAAAVQIAKAFESASLALGDSGFLAGVTAVALGVAALITMFAKLPAPVLATVGVMAAVAASVGPVVFIVGKLVGVWGMILQLGPRLAVAFASIAAGEAAVGAAAVEASVGVGILSRTLAVLGGPWGIAIMAIALAIGVVATSSNEAAEATGEYRKQQQALDELHARSLSVLDRLATATGKAREEALANAKALQQETRQYLANARAALIAAQAKAQQAKQNVAEALSKTDPRNSAGFAQAMAGAGGMMGSGIPLPNAGVVSANKEDRIAQANLSAANANVKKAQDDLANIESVIKAAEAPEVKPVTTNPDLSTGSGAHQRKKHGPTPEELARRKEELRLQTEIDVAEAQGDGKHAQELRDQLDLQRRIKDYEEAGLKPTEAKVAAEKDLAKIVAGRSEAIARELADDKLSNDLQAAQIAGNGTLAESLERQQYLAQRIAFYRSEQYDIEKATAAAIADQMKLDAARAASRKAAAEDAAAARDIQLAQARGDTDAHIRALQQADEIRRRSREYQNGANGQAPMSKADADARASTEVLQEEQARQIGVWRDTIKGGLRAALDGNFGDWFQNWWKDRVAKGMEQALNSLSDLIFSLFSKVLGKKDTGGGLGDIFSTIGKAVGLFAGSTTGGLSTAGASLGNLATKVPGFKTGGSFEVAGRSGIDANLVQFRATAGEMVKITKGDAEDAGHERIIIEPSPYFDARAARAAEPGIQQMGVRAAAGGSKIAEERATRKARRRLGR